MLSLYSLSGQYYKLHDLILKNLTQAVFDYETIYGDGGFYTTEENSWISVHTREK